MFIVAAAIFYLFRRLHRSRNAAPMPALIVVRNTVGGSCSARDLVARQRSRRKVVVRMPRLICEKPANSPV